MKRGYFLFIVILVWLTPYTAVWAAESLGEIVASLQTRIAVIEDRIALSDIRPFTVDYDAGTGLHVREGSGNWTGTVTFSEPGMRVFIIQLENPVCGQEVTLSHQGGTAATQLIYYCAWNDPPAVTGGKVLSFYDDQREFQDHNFPVGEYAINVIKAEGDWTITIMGDAG